MRIKQLYNDNLRKLPNKYGDVSVMKSSMDSFSEYILDSISLFKVVDFKFLGLHKLVWFLLHK